MVIASDGTPSGQAIVYDLTNHTSSARAASSAVLLSNFVARLGADELWLLGGDENLYELSLATAMLQKKPLPFVPAGLNIVPAHDLIVLNDTAAGDLHYYDPTTSSVAFSIVRRPVSRPEASWQLRRASAYNQPWPPSGTWRWRWQRRRMCR